MPSSTAPTTCHLRSRPGAVKFYYDHKSHWVTDNRGSVIARGGGQLPVRARLGADWDPSCLRSWLQDVDGDGTYTFETTALPTGSYETKVAINESWDENYGPNGEPEQPEQHRVLRPERQRQGHDELRLRDPRPVDHRRGRSRRTRRSGSPVALRPRPQGLPGHRSQPDVEGLVHGGRRRPQRRLLPDGRQHQRRDAAVHRQRWVDVHRPPGPRHDLHRRRDRGHRWDGLPGDRVREPRHVLDRHRLHHRPGSKHAADAT